MEKSIKYFPIRRSTRLPLEIPLRVTSLDPKIEFAEDCTTVTVNAHGCGVISSRRLAAGTRVRLEITADKRAANARVHDVVPLSDDNTSWLLGMEMEHAGNFWGIKYAPADWVDEDTTSGAAPSSPQAGSATVAARPSSAATKEIPEAVLKRLLSECRLAAVSLGACYVQTGTTFPIHAPVMVTVRAADSEHTFHGNVRVEYVGSGMGIEFTGQGEEHRNRIAALIDDLSKNGDKIPEVRVALAPPEKTVAKPKGKPSGTVQYDSLLGLILVGGALKRSDFLRELEKQRRHG
ncbi:MAG TPA: hypothetical protein VJX16_27210 [Terriglobales bacterium]|nr:hypothetical protein [Terriglobales bacterium]